MSIKIILDSGAYSVFKKGKVIDIDEYAEFVLKNSELFTNVANLDVIGNAKESYNNWMYLRKKGVNVLPIYHIGTDEKYLRRYLKDSKYLMLGAVASLSSNKRLVGLDYIFKKYLLGEDGFPKVKVHGLGITTMSVVLRYPWYSVDSSRMVLAAANGRIFLPAIKRKCKNEFEFDYENISPFQISNQARIIVGMVGTFGNIPKAYQELYRTFCKKNGYEIGNLYYIEKQELAKKHLRREKVFNKIFDLAQKDNVNKKTLANDYKERFKWNMFISNEIQKRMPEYSRLLSKEQHLAKEQVLHPTLVYDVVASSVFMKIARHSNFLVSYAFMSEGLLKLIKKIKRNENKN